MLSDAVGYTGACEPAGDGRAVWDSRRPWGGAAQKAALWSDSLGWNQLQPHELCGLAPNLCLDCALIDKTLPGVIVKKNEVHV